MRGLPQAIEIALRGAIVNDDVPALNVAKVAQTLPEVIPDRRIVNNANVGDPNGGLLCARRERCCDGCAADKRGEFA